MNSMTMTPARPARWITDGRADLRLVAAELASGPRIPVPSGYWGVEAITGCGHRMAHSGFTAGDVVSEAAHRSWTKCEECGRELVGHAGVAGRVTFLELR
jgi:hypothetical protein